MTSVAPRIAVVGAGIVGASLAYHLARRGAAVTLLEQGQPGEGVTGKAFAWINVSHGISEADAPLRRRALAEWRRLENELGEALRLAWGGALTWAAAPVETERRARERVERGFEVQLLERAAIAALEPALRTPPACACYAPGEGAVDPIAATRALVQAAQRAGALFRPGLEVRTLTAGDGGITGLDTAEGRLEADLVVVAAGTGSGALCAPLGLTLPIEVSPALLLRFRTPGPLVRRVLSGPELEVRQLSPDRLLVAEDYVDYSPENGPTAVARRTLDALGRELHGGAAAVLESVQVGLRPIPADGRPLLGPMPGIEGLWLAVMHAGITLAPLVGRLLAEALLDDAAAALAP